MLNVQLLLTGNELMSGDIVDTNSVFIARELKNLGVELTRKVTVGDNMQLLTEQMEQLSKDADILIINGGLGPTVDDMTAQALSETTKQSLAIHPTALEQVKAWCVKRSYRLTGPNLKQALLPTGCDIVHNPIGSAPGFSINHNSCQIICTPGVPVELKAMLREEILPNIAEQLPEELQTVTQKLKVFGIGESGLQKMVNDSYPNWPEEIELGFRATMPLLEVKLTSRSHTSTTLRDEWYSKIKGLLGQHIVSENGDSIAATVVKLLKQNGKTITTAESCTGGMIAAQLTGVAGCSDVFEAGFVTYSNRMKEKLVNVNAQTLEQFGAVSEQVVKEMVSGALAVSAADYAVSVSGVAGPDGGTEDKPVGTVWLAWANKQQVFTKKLYLPTHRIHFQNFIANTGLDLIRRLILGYHDEPRYFVERQFNSKT
ncbi:CinA family nicotinamide mononucleotide deamidase-related protein [Thalassotalea fonticola]|uniref:CinA-like protein n=1 Tax=Thalassotalea fonticola TaxID=3065649 RepID=A0ABZ0GTL3_9GAMM|nr:CinA family nicotinamide mononucleotide deamidase-related protein [Colwelliaceae bacterium S1-1]